MASNAIVGSDKNGFTVHADDVAAKSFNLWTRTQTAHVDHPTLDEWVANYATLEAAVAAHPDAEVLNGRLVTPVDTASLEPQ